MPGRNGSSPAVCHGDGVVEDDYKAFKFFQKVVGQGIDPGSEDNLRFQRIEFSGELHQARHSRLSRQVRPGCGARHYAQAAWSFGDPAAQFELGQMF